MTAPSRPRRRCGYLRATAGIIGYCTLVRGKAAHLARNRFESSIIPPGHNSAKCTPDSQNVRQISNPTNAHIHRASTPDYEHPHTLGAFRPPVSRITTCSRMQIMHRSGSSTSLRCSPSAPQRAASRPRHRCRSLRARRQALHVASAQIYEKILCERDADQMNGTQTK